MTQGDRDLIERLRAYRPRDEWGDGCRHFICDEAADRLEALSAEVEMYRGALATCDDAIREYFRYFHGGEMRGSYDGKPERAQLQKAGHAAFQALKGAQQ